MQNRNKAVFLPAMRYLFLLIQIVLLDVVADVLCGERSMVEPSFEELLHFYEIEVRK